MDSLQYCTIRRLRLFSIVLYTLHLLRRLSILGGSIFGLDGAFIGLTIFLNASMAFWIKIIIFILGLKSTITERVMTVIWELTDLVEVKPTTFFIFLYSKNETRLLLKPETVQAFAVLETLFYIF